MFRVHRGSLNISTNVLHPHNLLEYNIWRCVTSSYCCIRLKRVAVIYIYMYIYISTASNKGFFNYLHKFVVYENHIYTSLKRPHHVAYLPTRYSNGS
jgi:hypothetical protein